jgi:hypothetical protein
VGVAYFDNLAIEPMVPNEQAAPAQPPPAGGMGVQTSGFFKR